MRHTVIGIFDTYDQAEVARSALFASGFATGDIELQAAPESRSPADPSLTPGGAEHSDTSILGNIERFFSMLFSGRERPPEVEHYSEAVRRGAVLVAVDADTDDRANLARQTLAQQGAIDIDERAASWGTLGHDASASRPAVRCDDRDHSLLDELGLGSGSAVPGTAPVNPPSDPLAPVRADVGRARAYPRADQGDPALDPLDPVTPVARDSFAESSDPTYRPTGVDPATGGTLAAGWRPVEARDPLDETEAAARADASVARSLSQSPSGSSAGSNATIPDEYMEYEDDFRTDYQSNYAATGAPYEEYEHAYRYGATAGTDERYRNRDWDEAMEIDLKRDWQSRNPQGEDTWERVKLAVRHGWDRVTGHHHQ
jgi:hypothetical protein